MLKSTQRTELLRAELARQVEQIHAFKQTVPEIDDVTDEVEISVAVDALVGLAQIERLNKAAARIAEQIAELESAEFITFSAMARESL